MAIVILKKFRNVSNTNLNTVYLFRIIGKCRLILSIYLLYLPTIAYLSYTFFIVLEELSFVKWRLNEFIRSNYVPHKKDEEQNLYMYEMIREKEAYFDQSVIKLNITLKYFNHKRKCCAFECKSSVLIFDARNFLYQIAG